MAEARLLVPGDEAALEAFLSRHAESSLILRSNLRKAGLSPDRGERYQGTWFGAFEAGRLVGAAALAWNGNLILQAPAGIGAIAAHLRQAAPRLLRGILGPTAQAAAAADALGIAPARFGTDKPDLLFSLRLEDLFVPAALAEGRAAGRLARPSDAAFLDGWLADFSMEALKLPDTPDLRREAREGVEARTAEGVLWVLEEAGRPVATTAISARLPDCVQVGGVWTPPELRRRGYARAAVAGSLLDARAAGATRAVLFTDNPWARRSYEALGFRQAGDYALRFLREPFELRA